MGGQAFINTHSLEELSAEFAGLKAPSARMTNLLDVTTSVVPDTVTGKVSLGPFKKLLAGFVEKRRIAAAAWHWLKPDLPGDLGRLKAMRARLGLAYLTLGEFAERVSEACRSVAEDHPGLARHADARIANLEYWYKTTREVDRDAQAFEVNSRFELYQRQLITAALNASTPSARSGIQTLVPESIATAAAELRSALVDSSELSTFHANLMVPMRYHGSVADIPRALGPFGDTDGAREAARLWADLGGEVHKVLVVVAETRGSHYRGFWIPDVRKNGLCLAGAPRALHEAAPQAIFVDDLPPFPLDDSVVEARWRQYLLGGKPGHFLGKMFVSLPIFQVMAADQVEPCAVLNVNLMGGELWKRAYSSYWLERASRRAAPWASTAWHATRLEFEIVNPTMPLKCGLELPMLRASNDRMLESPQEDGEQGTGR